VNYYPVAPAFSWSPPSASAKSPSPTPSAADNATPTPHYPGQESQKPGQISAFISPPPAQKSSTKDSPPAPTTKAPWCPEAYHGNACW
jgi:hypothetical protein